MEAIGANNTALLLIDVQRAFLEWEREGHRRNNKDAMANIIALLDGFRKLSMAVFHIRHGSTKQDSALRPELPGFLPMPGVEELPDEPVLVKSVNSAFIGTDLERLLRERGYTTLIIAGITTNHCVETTTRMAGNLGFDTRLASDACYTFDQTGPDGTVHSARSVHQMTLSNLNDEFAQIVTTDEVLSAIPIPAA